MEAASRHYWIDRRLCISTIRVKPCGVSCRVPRECAMVKLVTIILRWMAQKLLVLAVVLAILLLGAWVRMEWGRITEDEEAIAKKGEILGSLEDSRAAMVARMAPKLAEWDRARQGKVSGVKAELAGLDAEIRRKAEEWPRKMADFGDLEKAAETSRRSLEAAVGKRDKLAREVWWWQRGTYFLSEESREKVDDYEKAKAEVFVRAKAHKAAVAARDALGKVLRSSPVRALQERRHKKEADLEAARNFKTPDEARWEAQKRQKDNEIRELRGLIDSERRRIASKPVQKFRDAVLTHLPAAVWILAGIILTPVAIKAFLYYALAPLAARLPPVRIVEKEDTAMPEAKDSSVSIPLDIPDGFEVLVHPDFLQSSSLPAVKRTQWLLNRSVPFSSIASGMFFLTRISPVDGRQTRVVVSSQSDAFGEIGSVRLPAGASMVIHPRALAGVVKQSGCPVRITRHWRILSLHAWLTLQLRFMVFHGPCELILKGCRGVRAEAPDPGCPRMLNQASTIGFSANLDYRNTRCETFISYLRGKEDLFNDLFGGGRGLFVYEEMPAVRRKTGLTGRGLEGVLDAALKAFGI